MNKPDSITAVPNTPLAAQLLARMKSGEPVKVPHATAKDLNGFEPQRSKCHENVDRWCREHPGQRPLRGWLITSTVFDRHSIVDRGAAGLLDVTPLAFSYFLPHEGSEDEFAKLPHQVIALDL